MLLRENKARAISFSGIVLAFNLIVLVLLNILPLNTIAMLVAASLFSSVVVIEAGTLYAFIFTIASDLLGFFIISDKVHFFTYLFVFSFYGVVKYIIEKNIKKLPLQYAAKTLYAMAAFGLLYYAVRLIIGFDLNILYFIGFEVAFIAYDYFYSIFIKYYIDKIRKYIKK